MANESDQVQAYWESLGGSACPDDIVRDMSIHQIVSRLCKNARVLDLGCGNGFCTLQFAQTSIDSITGVDYSSTSIEQAKQARLLFPERIRVKTDFRQGDALALDFNEETFDIAITIRCLINVGGHDKQLKGLYEIHRALKPNGIYLMCENTISGLRNINGARQLVGLHEIKTRWHNKYIDDKLFFIEVNRLFDVIEANHFASTYYLISRVINAWLSHEKGMEPKYDDEINVMASKLPPAGEFSPMRLYVLKKKHADGSDT